LWDHVALDRIRSIQIDGTADDFCQIVEKHLDRRVVNETNLQGQFAFDAESGAGTYMIFLKRLYDQTGLLITPAQRTLEILVFRPRFPKWVRRNRIPLGGELLSEAGGTAVCRPYPPATFFLS